MESQNINQRLIWSPNKTFLSSWWRSLCWQYVSYFTTALLSWKCVLGHYHSAKPIHKASSVLWLRKIDSHTRLGLSMQRSHPVPLAWKQNQSILVSPLPKHSRLSWCQRKILVSSKHSTFSQSFFESFRRHHLAPDLGWVIDILYSFHFGIIAISCSPFLPCSRLQFCPRCPLTAFWTCPCCIPVLYMHDELRSRVSLIDWLIDCNQEPRVGLGCKCLTVSA